MNWKGNERGVVLKLGAAMLLDGCDELGVERFSAKLHIFGGDVGEALLTEILFIRVAAFSNAVGKEDEPVARIERQHFFAVFPVGKMSAHCATRDQPMQAAIAAHQHAAVGEIRGLPAKFAVALTQHHRKIAGQAIVAAPVADLGLAHESDEAGLQLGCEARCLLSGAVDRDPALFGAREGWTA